MANKEETEETSTNPYIDDNLMKAQENFNPHQNEEFEQKHQIEENKPKKHEMHPFSQKILNGTDECLLALCRRDKARNPVVYRARFKDGNIENGFDSNPIEIFWR